LVSLTLLLVGCKKHPYDLALLRKEGKAIAEAIEKYQHDTGERFQGNFSILVPKYLPVAPAQGQIPGTWGMGAGFLLRETDTITLGFFLRDGARTQEFLIYERGKGWRKIRNRKS
jgi:hypothetical protein